MGFILKYLIVVALLYVAYRKADKRFAVTEEFDATVVSKFTNKNGKAISSEDDSQLNVKDEWNYYLVLKEDSNLSPDTVVGEVSPEDASSSSLREEVSIGLYNKVSLGDRVTVKVHYSRWTKKLLRTEVLPGWAEEVDDTVAPEKANDGAETASKE